MIMKIVFTGWFGFWLFVSVYLIIEGVMYLNGHETATWKHRTVEEKQIQQNQINERCDDSN